MPACAEYECFPALRKTLLSSTRTSLSLTLLDREGARRDTQTRQDESCSAHHVEDNQKKKREQKTAPSTIKTKTEGFFFSERGKTGPSFSELNPSLSLCFRTQEKRRKKKTERETKKKATSSRKEQ